jgi:hypothetical protein
LGYEVERGFLGAPDVSREGRRLHQGVEGCGVAERLVAQEGCVLLAEEALVVAVARVRGDERGVEGGGEERARGEGLRAVRGRGRGGPPRLGREAALGAVDAGQALVGVLGGG